MNKVYTGIGSRETPQEIKEFFIKFGSFMAKREYILRSGHADGADISFEIGCDKANGNKEIYLPWYRFEGSNSQYIVKDIKAFEIAEKYHPYWYNLKEGAKKLQARNTHQVLGWDLETPTDFIICWTKNGKRSGGTGQALRIADDYNIPIFDCGGYNDFAEIKKKLLKFITNNGFENNDTVK